MHPALETAHLPVGWINVQKKLVMISTYNTMCNPFDHAMYMCMSCPYITVQE
jgi:hypothetical protein